MLWDIQVWYVGENRQLGVNVMLNNSFQWDVYFDQLEPIATRVPYMVGIGNHERNYPNTM